MNEEEKSTKLVGDEQGEFLLREAYNEPDFFKPSSGFEHVAYRHISTELTPQPFGATQIFELGFLRSNPNQTIYMHKSIPALYLQESGELDFSKRDRIGIRVRVFKVLGNNVTKELYSSTSPVKEDIEKVLV